MSVSIRVDRAHTDEQDAEEAVQSGSTAGLCASIRTIEAYAIAG